MTITSITIENFKGIRDRVTIDLKPITLLFGPNSAGKSTIIQALHYAWEVIGRHNLDPNFTEFGGQEMDLGGFENLVHGHDLNRSISIRVDMDLTGRPLSIYGEKEEVMKWQLPYADEDLDGMLEGSVPILRWNIGKKDILNAWIEFKVSWSEATAKFQVTSYEVGFNNEMISKIKIEPHNGKVNIAYINFFHPLLLIKNDEYEPDCFWRNNLISTLAKKPDIWLDEKAFSPDQYKEYSSLLEKLSKNFDDPDKITDDHSQNDALEKMTDEELRQMAKNYGYSNKILKLFGRELSIDIIKTARNNEKNKSKKDKLLKNMTLAELRQIAKSYDFYKKSKIESFGHGFVRGFLLAFLNMEQRNERYEHEAKKREQESFQQERERREQINKKVFERIKPLLPYEFLFVCIEVFGIHSIQEDLNIECFGLNDALPAKEGSFDLKEGTSSLDIDSKRYDDLYEEKIFCYNAIDSAIKQFILGPLDILRVELEKLHYLGPIRSRIPRNYIPNRYIENRNWPDGLAAWDVLHKENEKIVSQADHWMGARLNSGYSIFRKTYKEIDISQVTAKNKGLAKQYNSASTKTRLFLMDQKSGVEVQPPDVGVGISQVIPVIVSALYFKDGIVTIEQPELHIHPALQVTLGDLFISQIQEKNPCFILETHSEHMLLRLLRRIRETHEKTLPNGINKLSPDQLKIYYIERDQNGVKISDLEIDETGEFKDEWPNGFFEEREEELFY